MISANGVTLQYGKRILFENVNIMFSPGNCYGLIGANGSGKSTLVNGILHPALTRLLHGAREVPGKHRSLAGHELVDKVIDIKPEPYPGKNDKADT